MTPIEAFASTYYSSAQSPSESNKPFRSEHSSGDVLNRTIESRRYEVDIKFHK